jgi:hypothetical protein
MSFDETIIHCGAPALCGLKPANLFSLSRENAVCGAKKIFEWNSQFSKEKKVFVPVKTADGRNLLFLYNRTLLEKIICNSESIKYLRSKNYPVDKGFDCILAQMLHRLAVNTCFPHEVGLFLGYPLEDVIGFEANMAEGFKYSGIWKVYGNKEKAVKRMKSYRDCTKKCMKLLSSGLSVPMTAKKYIHKKGVI